jgi:arylsulfatase A-like enzyme
MGVLHMVTRKFPALALLLVLALGGCATSSNKTASREENRVLLIVLDGLRPDYVTPERMPNLHALGERGVVAENHHAVFPTVTRVNATTFATGVYPDKHGVVDNAMYLPDIEPKGALSTGDYKNLHRIEAATGGNLVQVPSIGEILRANGKKMLVVSSGSTGSCFLLNHKVDKEGTFESAQGGIIHHGYTYPAGESERVLKALGEPAPDGAPNTGRNRRAVDAYIRFGLDEIQPDVTYMWLSDPDHTAHEYGIGAPETWESIRQVDAEIGRILQAHEERGLTDKVNIFVSSDHGFTTHAGDKGWKVRDALIDRGMNRGTKFGRNPTAVHVQGGMIFLEDPSQTNLARTAIALQRHADVFTFLTRTSAEDSNASVLQGTLPLSVLNYEHPRSPDVVALPDWDDRENEHGFSGYTSQGGTAGHGSLSKFDVHNTLIATGPHIKDALRSAVPTGNMDFAPTILGLLRIESPEHMDGRVLEELLIGGPNPEAMIVTRDTVTANFDHATVEGQHWRAESMIYRSTVRGHTYIDYLLGGLFVPYRFGYDARPILFVPGR